MLGFSLIGSPRKVHPFESQYFLELFCFALATTLGYAGAASLASVGVGPSQNKRTSLTSDQKMTAGDSRGGISKIRKVVNF